MAPRLQLYQRGVDDELRFAALALQRANEQEVRARESMQMSKQIAASMAFRSAAIERQAAITAERRASQMAREGRYYTRCFNNRLRERREEEAAFKRNVPENEENNDEEESE